MGAEWFEETASGETADEAFGHAREEAFYAYGHAGYTGSIAEKSAFVELRAPAGITGREFASWVADTYWEYKVDDQGRDIKTWNYPDKAPESIWQALRDAVRETDDKWGPAGCVRLGPNTWVFFGWASS